nr:class A beta-lactamase [Gordonia araii]
MNRRAVLVGALAVAAGITVPLALRGESTTGRIAALERRHNARIGVFAADLGSERTVAHRADESFAMCSTFKTYAAARVLQLVERGTLSLDTGVFVDAAEIVENSPVTQRHASSTMTVSQLCEAALQQSDNTAGNLLLRAIDGPQGVTAFARSIGDGRTRLDRWETALNAAVPGDPRDTSTPSALAGGYRALLAGDALSPASRERLDDWMRGNQTSSMRAGLPDGWTSADKTGAGDYGSTNDVGIAYSPGGGRILLAVMIRSAADDPDAEGFRPLIGEVAGLVVGALR